MATIALLSAPLTEAAVDAIVIGVSPPEDDNGTVPVLAPGANPVDAALGGKLAQALSDLGARGKPGEIHRIATLGATTGTVVVAVGLGARKDGWTTDTLRKAAGASVRSLAGSGSVALALAGVNGTPATLADDAGAVAEGALLGAYAFTGYRAKLDRPPVAEVFVEVPDGASADTVTTAVNEAKSVVDGVALARDLVNTPPADLPPATLASIAADAARDAGLEVEILDEAALLSGGYGGLSGVGQGSVRPPQLVRIAWSPAGATKTLALVGKGITFDSGGLSLKPPGSMETMKSDMAGAAATLGAVLAVAALKLPIKVVGWLALAENMPSGTAIRPSDVLTMYGGKRVEVLNTDAEGRLVLADAITRAAEESPDAIVDIATLTGAQLVALGSRTAGLMGNDDDFKDEVVAAAKESGEPIWAMPMPEELRRGLDSPIADLANVPASGGGRDGGMMTAAHFLAEFVPDGLAWAHLDIAGPSWNGGEPYGFVSKGGTGFATRTLVRLAARMA